MNLRKRAPRDQAPAAPDGYDEDAYLVANPDVAAAITAGVFPSGLDHYLACGRAEGRALSGGPFDRVERVLETIDRDGLGLEVGPSHSPMAPKAAGFRVHVLDHVDAATLRARYESEGHEAVDTSLIEEVDFVWKGEPLAEVVGGEGIYDWVISSHSIEHMPDPIAFLQGCEQILASGGRLALVVPDFRYCFDTYGSPTTTGMLLDAHREQRTMPSSGQVFDYLSRCASLDDAIAWSAGTPGDPDLLYDRSKSVQGYADASAGADFSGDLHCWRFTPQTFAVILDDLLGLGLIGLAVVASHDTFGAEFWVTLGQGGEPADERTRAELLRAARRSLAG